MIRRAQLFPRLAETPDINRGEQRLAAEATLATLAGRDVPLNICLRASVTLEVMARG